MNTRLGKYMIIFTKKITYCIRFNTFYDLKNSLNVCKKIIRNNCIKPEMPIQATKECTFMFL